MSESSAPAELLPFLDANVGSTGRELSALCDLGIPHAISSHI
jgi:hypothetical protein